MTTEKRLLSQHSLDVLANRRRGVLVPIMPSVPDGRSAESRAANPKLPPTQEELMDALGIPKKVAPPTQAEIMDAAGIPKGPVAVPTGTTEPLPKAGPVEKSVFLPAKPGEREGAQLYQQREAPKPTLLERLAPEGTFSLGAGRFAREVGQTALGNVGRILSPLGSALEPATRLADALAEGLGTPTREGLTPGETLLEALFLGKPIGTPAIGGVSALRRELGTAGRAATQAVEKTAPVVRRLATEEVGAVGRKALKSEPFFVQTQSGWKPVEGRPVTFQSWPGEQFFVHRDIGAKTWVVSEARTGTAVVTGELTSAKAIESARARMAQLAPEQYRGTYLSAKEGFLKRHGESPRFAKQPSQALAEGQGEMPLTKPAASEALGPAAKPAQATEGVAKPHYTVGAGYPTTAGGKPVTRWDVLTDGQPSGRTFKTKAEAEAAAVRFEQARTNILSEAPVGARRTPQPSPESVQQMAAESRAAPTGAPTSAAGQVPPSPAPAAPPIKPPSKPPVTTGAVPPEEPFAANIRLSKYPEDIRGPIKEWADANPEAVQAARRGVRPDAEVLADAQKLVEDMGGDFAKIQKRWKPGEAWNAEEVTAIRGTLRAKTDDVLQAAQVAKGDNSAANHAKLLIALQEQARVQGIVHGVTAEAGRALRSFRQEAFDAIKANNNQRLEELLRRVGDRAKLDDVAAAIAQLDLKNPVAVNEFMRNLTKPKFWDYVMELYINSILSGPKTHIINALSNTVNAMASPVERFTAAGVERILAPLQRRHPERFFDEASADAFGAIEGIREGVRAGVATMKNGINPSQLSKWEFRRTAFKGNWGRVIRGPGTFLEAADATNYAINYRAALGAGIKRQARKEGLTGLALRNRVAELKMSPTEELITQASRTAEYRLFRQEGEFANAVMAFREKYPPLRFVAPFVRTPVNLLKYGIERSPIGIVDPRLWRNLAAKNPEASDQIARIFLGSSIGGLFAWQIAEGNLDITGAAPKNAAERDRFYREGKLPFAVKIGGTWIQYQRLEPFNQIFAQLAASIEAIRSEDTTASEKAGLVGFTIGQNLVSQTFFSGLNDLLNMLFEPERYGSQYLSRLLASGVPFSSALRTAAQMADPTFRRPRTVGETLQAGIPGLSQNVPPVLTAFGEEAPRKSPAFSPIQVTREQQSAIDAELERLGIEVGFVGTTIGGVKLSREEQQRYQVLAGQITQTELAELIGSAYYQGLSDVGKEKSLSRIIDSAREKARTAMSKKTPAPRSQPTLTPARRPLRRVKRTPTPEPAGVP